MITIRAVISLGRCRFGEMFTGPYEPISGALVWRRLHETHRSCFEVYGQGPPLKQTKTRWLRT